MKPCSTSKRYESLSNNDPNVTVVENRNSRHTSWQAPVRSNSRLQISAKSQSLIKSKTIKDKCALVILEELLEERTVKDRRQKHQPMLYVTDRRKLLRRGSDKSAPR